MQGWDDQQQPHQHGKSDGGIVPVPLYPRVRSPCAWIAQAHWACGQVTIKKVIFSSRCIVQSEKSRSLWNICLQQKLAVFLYIHETQSWLSSWKKLKLKFRRTQSPRHFAFTPGKHSTGYSPSFPKAPALELAGELSPMLGAMHVQRMSKSLLVPFNCCCLNISQPQDLLSNKTSQDPCQYTRHASGQRGTWVQDGDCHSEQVPAVASPLPWWCVCTARRPRSSRKSKKSPSLLVSLCSSVLLSLYFYLLSI